MFKKLAQSKFVTYLSDVTKKRMIPGFQGLAIYDVAKFFSKSIAKGDVINRANSLSFSFFIALFPSILMFFNLIPYIPLEGFKITLLNTIQDFLPDATYESVRSTIEEIIIRKNGGLLSISFLLSLIFSTNGTAAMIDSFNKTHYAIETRSFFKQRLMATYLVLLISLILIITVVAIIVGSNILTEISNRGIIKSNIMLHIINISRFIIIAAMVLLTVSLIYYVAPAKEMPFRFVSPGAIMATILFIIATIGFNYYIQNFSKYNALYGSIGTLIIFMLWINFNSFILLLGFDLNASISRLLVERKLEEQNE